jgi:hypothetical protein
MGSAANTITAALYLHCVSPLYCVKHARLRPKLMRHPNPIQTRYLVHGVG